LSSSLSKTRGQPPTCLKAGLRNALAQLRFPVDTKSLKVQRYLPPFFPLLFWFRVKCGKSNRCLSCVEWRYKVFLFLLFCFFCPRSARGHTPSIFCLASKPLSFFQQDHGRLAQVFPCSVHPSEKNRLCTLLRLPHTPFAQEGTHHCSVIFLVLLRTDAVILPYSLAACTAGRLDESSRILSPSKGLGRPSPSSPLPVGRRDLEVEFQPAMYLKPFGRMESYATFLSSLFPGVHPSLSYPRFFCSLPPVITYALSAALLIFPSQRDFSFPIDFHSTQPRSLLPHVLPGGTSNRPFFPLFSPG